MPTILGPSGSVLATNVRVASRPLERMVGLLNGPPPAPGDALVLPGATQVHTVGLGFAIDVAFCGADGTVLHVVTEMRPGRLSRWVRGSVHAIETRAGALASVARGDALTITDP